ncbi:MAG: hypothetical protein K9W42_07925 [Candidatus Heimdallarchaeota archaeon]|nr:hypothetical protein [Candidatus Heimdallarchaeota archaeon]
MERFLTDPRVEKLVLEGKINLNYDFLINKSFLEKFLFLGFKVRKNHWLGYPISSLLIYSIYLIYSISVSLGMSNWTFFSFSNYFFVRDSLLAIFMPPMYMLIIKKIKELPLLIRQDLNVSENDFQAFFSDFFHRFNKALLMIISGVVFSATYLGIIIFYVVRNIYSVHFFLHRLIATFGLFIIGAVFYQGLIALKWFVFDVNKKLEVHLSALFNGLKPVGELASFSVFVYMFGIAITLIPVAFYGYNPKHLIWYICFQGILFLFGILLFICIIFGFHRKMLSTKSNYLHSITSLLNESSTIEPILKIERADKKYISNEITSVNPLIELMSLINNAKEWPFDFRRILDLVVSYILPGIFSILGFYQ